MSDFSALAGKTVGVLGAGYLGQHLTRFLEKQSSVQVTLFDRATAARAFEREFDFFVHAAGNTGNFRSEPLKTVDSNVSLTADLLRRLRVREAMIFLSSTRVYGFSGGTRPHPESDPTPLNHLSLDFLYDGSKLMMESLAHNASRVVPYPVRVARLSNVYGDFSEPLDDSTLLKKMILHARRSQPLDVADAAQSSKDYVHVRDVVDGLVRLMLFRGNESIFNIASGDSASLESVAGILGLQARFDPQATPRHCPISIEKARQLLHFEPRVSLTQGLTPKENR